MAMLSRDAILAADDLQKELVAVPEWGGDVWVRCMTATERDEWEASVVTMDNKGQNPKADLRNIRAKLVVRCVIDEAGVRVFGEEDTVALGAKSAAALDRLYAVAARLSKISKEDEKELLGNSDADQPESSL
jgi:hypothetical protein